MAATSMYRRIAALVALALLAPLLALASSPNAQAQGGPEFSTTPEDTWQTNGEVNVILPVGDTVYIGGEFTELNDGNGNSVTRNNLAAISRSTGAPTPFDPDLNRKVFGLTTSPDGSTLYAVGAFTTAGTSNRKRVAAFDIATGALTSFNPPSPNNVVRAVGTNGTLLYIGGHFNSVGGVDRLRLAAYDLATETLSNDWAPTASSTVRGFVVDPTKIWIAGNFSRINSRAARGLATVDPVDATLFNTDHPSVPILAIAEQGNQIFVAGAGPGGTGFAFDRTTGDEQWATKANGNLQAVGVVGDWAYFGGHHDRVGGVDVGQFTRFSIVDGDFDETWLPNVNGLRGVNGVATDASNLYVGGDFTFVSGDRHQGFAMFSDGPNVEPNPELITLTMFDNDQNGYVDTVEALFSTPVSCAAPCLSGWNLTNVPSDGSLASVSIAGSVVTLHLDEGSDEPDTGAGDFKVALINGVQDGAGNPATFVPTTPADEAAPVPVKFRKTNIGTPGLAEPGDTIETVWSESLDPASLPTATDVVIADPTEAGNDLLALPGLMDGDLDLGSDDYLLCPVDGCAPDEEPEPPVGDGEPNMNVLFVAGNTTPPSGDRAIRDVLLDAGFSLTFVDDDADLTALDTSDAGLIVIASSVVPTKVGDVFKDLAVPILTWENFLFSDLALSNEGTTSVQTQVTIADPAHPAAAGYTGTATVYTAANRMSWGQPTSDADIIAHVPFRTDQPVMFAYEAGDMLTDGSTAAAARIAVFPDYAGATKLTSFGEDLIAAAALSVVQPSEPPPPPPAETPEVVFAASPVTLSTNGLVATVTLGACTGDCGDLAPGPRTTVTYVAPPSLTDLAGNGAAGTNVKELKLF